MSKCVEYEYEVYLYSQSVIQLLYSQDENFDATIKKRLCCCKGKSNCNDEFGWNSPSITLDQVSCLIFFHLQFSSSGHCEQKASSGKNNSSGCVNGVQSHSCYLHSHFFLHSQLILSFIVNVLYLFPVLPLNKSTCVFATNKSFEVHIPYLI